MAVVRLLGQRISYSASPAMQEAGFRALGLSHRYVLSDVAPAELPDSVAALRDSDDLGANVTTPHKGAVLSLVDELDELAARSGALNTVVRRDGRLLGSNTDIPAIADEIALLRARPKNAVVLGAGGAARAVAIALETLGTEQVQLVSRSGADGSVAWERLAELLRSADLLVNATPVGTGSAESPVPAALLQRGLAVLDLVYRPSPTRLVRDARDAGAPARAGAGVLLGQGRRSFEAWLGVPAPRQAMAAALRAELGDAADV